MPDLLSAGGTISIAQFSSRHYFGSENISIVSLDQSLDHTSKAARSAIKLEWVTSFYSLSGPNPICPEWLPKPEARRRGLWVSWMADRIRAGQSLQSRGVFFFVIWSAINVVVCIGTFYFCQDSEVCIWCTLYYPIRPHERICEWQWSDTTDTGRLHDRNNMADIVPLNFIDTTHIHAI